MKNENVIKMARLMVGCKDRTCEDCLSQSKKLFGDNECALIEYAEVLDKAGYRKQSETVKEFAEKIMDKNCRNCEHAFLETCKGCNTLPPNNTYENFELRKDITAEKHRADVAEEALRNGAVGEDLYCSSDNERERLYLHLLKEAEARLNELQGEAE